MDAIEKIDLDFDTSFLLAKEAQDRGYEIFYYNPKDLEYKNRSIFALGHFVELFNDKNRYYNYLYSKNLLRFVNNLYNKNKKETRSLWGSVCQSVGFGLDCVWNI